MHEVEWRERRLFTTCQEKWRANSTDREFREAHISRVDFVSQFGDDVGVCRSRQSWHCWRSEVSHKTHERAPEWTHARNSKGRYLVKNKRCVLTYARQTSDETLQVHVDSDWAGDLLGRKSTTGVIVRRGKHLLRHMSCLQTLVALSSGEAEYYALIRGACTSLGIQSHYQDWMIDVPIQIYSDSSAARSVARRRGIGGRLRHLQTRHLWLQSRVALGHLKLDVVAGERNPADTLTKPLPGRKIREWSEHVGQRWLQQSWQQQQRMMENIVRDAWWWTSSWIDPQSADRPGSLESFQQLQQSQKLQQQQKWLRTSRVDWAGEVKGSGQKRVEYPNSAWFLRRTSLEMKQIDDWSNANWVLHSGAERSWNLKRRWLWRDDVTQLGWMPAKSLFWSLEQFTQRAYHCAGNNYSY